MTRYTRAELVGTTVEGDLVTIPRAQRLEYDGDLRDWRRVRVIWNETRVVISRGAWEACSVETVS